MHGKVRESASLLKPSKKLSFPEENLGKKKQTFKS